MTRLFSGKASRKRSNKEWKVAKVASMKASSDDDDMMMMMMMMIMMLMILWLVARVRKEQGTPTLPSAAEEAIEVSDSEAWNRKY